MLVSTTAEAARNSDQNYDIDGQIYIGREYIGTAPKPGSADYGKKIEGDDFPQAYLVIQPPHSRTRPHFHTTNQFQVFVGGSGTVGKTRTDPVSVQYAGAHTPYGPILAEDQGIEYFTLRKTWDSGAKYLPAQRDDLEKGRQRQRIGIKQTDPREVATGEVIEETLIELEPDGLFVAHLTLAPQATTTLPDAAQGGGQYHVVLTGSLVRDGQEFPPLSVEFASPDEGAIEMQAGAAGLEILVLRFPQD
jgi:hypothetical protein